VPAPSTPPGAQTLGAQPELLCHLVCVGGGRVLQDRKVVPLASRASVARSHSGPTAFVAGTCQHCCFQDMVQSGNTGGEEGGTRGGGGNASQARGTK
jgi:hypothetical protein